MPDPLDLVFGPPGDPNLPPWGDPGEWQEVHERLAALIGNRWCAVAGPVLAAKNVESELGLLGPVMDSLCEPTCPTCADICCLAEKVWFDRLDLLQFHLAGRPIPEGQTRAALGEPCRYLSPTGCTQPRLIRPWRCTWFICEAQLAIIRTKPAREQRRISESINRLLAWRQRMAADMGELLEKLPQTPS